MLADGSNISLDGYDDLNPILLQEPNGLLVLLFLSDRPCGTCTAGYYNIFITESTDAYYPGDDELPTFNDPVVVNQSGSALNIDTVPINFQAMMALQGALVMYQTTGGIYQGAIMPPAFATGDIGIPTLLSNSSHSADSLLYTDFRNMQAITNDGADVYTSLFAVSDPGSIVPNDYLYYADNATPLSAAMSGYTDSLFLPLFGRLYQATQSGMLQDMVNFNDALDTADINITSISTLREPYYIFDRVVFSAYSNYGDNDLYFVDSHTVFTLLVLDGDFGNATDEATYRVFVTSAPVPGNFGGIGAADAICSGDPNNPDFLSTFKAIIATAGIRSGAVGAQIDWALYANTNYIRALDGRAIATTDANAIFPGTLTNAFTGVSEAAWTGMTAAYAPSGTDCSGWTSPAGNGDTGLTNSTTTSTVISSSPQTCGSPGSLYCAEQ